MKGDGSPFEFTPARADRARYGVLCIHGFTATPFDMRFLGARLADRGYRVKGPLLAGHGTTPRDLDRTTWRDWYQSVENAFDQLRSECDRIAVVGQSLGGLLTLRLAHQRGDEIAAIASLATPLWLFPLAQRVVRATRPGSPWRRIIRRLPKLKGSDIRDLAMKRQSPSYRVIPVRALHQLVEFMGLIRESLPGITTPAVIVHSKQDHTAPFACSNEMAARLGGEPVVHHALEKSYHLISIDVERAQVAEAVGDFLDERKELP